MHEAYFVTLQTVQINLFAHFQVTFFSLAKKHFPQWSVCLSVFIFIIYLIKRLWEQHFACDRTFVLTGKHFPNKSWRTRKVWFEVCACSRHHLENIVNTTNVFCKICIFRFWSNFPLSVLLQTRFWRHIRQKAGGWEELIEVSFIHRLNIYKGKVDVNVLLNNSNSQ